MHLPSATEGDTNNPSLLNTTCLPDLIDVHCHLTDTPDQLCLLASNVVTGKVALMGTRIDDWDLVLSTHAKHPYRTLSGLGIHPWFACKTLLHTTQWAALLESHLISTPTLYIGEIGVDKAAKDPVSNLIYDWDSQLSVFQVQWDLAIKYNRPVSMHCVHAQGWILEYMRAQSFKFSKSDKNQIYPPAIMLHSFNGSKELITQLVKLKGIGPRLYFSFSILVSSRSTQFGNRVLATPIDRLLLESDTHSAEYVDHAMAEILNSVSLILGWTCERTAKVTTENALRFFQCPQITNCI